MSNGNTVAITIVVVALIALFIIGTYVFTTGFSGSDSEETDSIQQNTQLQQELANLRSTNFELSNQISSLQSENSRLKNQINLGSSSSSTNDRVCRNLEDDKDEAKEELEEAEDDQDEVNKKLVALAAKIASQEGGATPEDLVEKARLEAEWEELDDEIKDLEDEYDEAKDDFRDADC